MQIPAVSTMFFHEYSCREIFALIEEAGLDGVEFWIETPDFWLRDCPADEIIALRRGFCIPETFTIHAPVLDLNPCSINPDVASVSVRNTLQAIRLASQMGAGIVTVHPGRRTAKRPPSPADHERFDRYIDALHKEASECGIRIAMENMEPAINSLLCTPIMMRELLDQEPFLSFTLDVAHALSGNPEDLSEYIRLCGDRLVNVHLSRAEGKRLHLPLDEAPVMGGILRLLTDSGYAGPLTLEIDDLTFGRDLTAAEKVAVLAADRSFILRTLS